MAIMNKPSEATIIAQGMTKAFINALSKRTPAKEYWKECSSTSRTISSSALEQLKKLCNGEN